MVGVLSTLVSKRKNFNILLLVLRCPTSTDWRFMYRLTPGSEAVQDIPEAVYTTTQGRSPRGVV